MPKNVAIVEPVGGHGGMNYYDLGLANGLNNCGVEAVLYTSTETITDAHCKVKVKKYFKGVWGNTPVIFRAFNFFFGLLRSLIDAKLSKVSIVHFHFFHYNLMQSLMLKITKLFGFKIVVTAHDVESFHGEKNAKRALGILTLADKVIAHNQISKQALLTKICLPEKMIAVIPHGNYIDQIDPRLPKVEACDALAIPADKVILFFGQIKSVKGLDCLLQAMPLVLENHPTAKLLIAGKVWKDDWSLYQKLIDDNGLGNSVIQHIKYIHDNDVVKYYSAADLIVLPYREIYQSGVLLMAMSYKTPVLVSDIPGMMEVVTDGVNGFSFKKGNSHDLADKITLALSDGTDLKMLSDVAHQDMKDKYDWAVVGEKTAKVYSSL
ncbi:glycosyltransferase family 4 protein [Shewanella abyssi]|uniref:glycosyltransferase family 4 protein n=1 Tax=Shewanella abyssi TaxID=311789 RepID=UPI00200DFC07|nr:glycosyltransferase family 4 protein [Shewanella abyssi]MCL1049560.1 glycosyltransferase family 4 protein [Shewanella abyssi]